MELHESNRREGSLVAVTMGDPTGVGPEAIVGAWASPRLAAAARVFVVGHPEIMRRAIAARNAPQRVVEIESSKEAEPSADVMPVLRSGADDVLSAPPARIDRRGGQAAYDALVIAARLALSGQIDALTTAPLNKAALHLAGHKYPGHTELLAELCGVDDFAMMLYLGPAPPLQGAAGLAVIHVTLHNALAQVFELLSPETVLSKIKLAEQVMRQLKGSAPRIGVCALNPHAGEEGLFGDEETRIIQPAIDHAAAQGIDVTGPIPADTLMVRARDGEFDAVVAMYHDQGHIAIKLLGMHRAVNVTLGLPIVRTSVAHGTAFDRAWQGGEVNASGMIEAVEVAARLARLR